jgi:hypothetical protein
MPASMNGLNEAAVPASSKSVEQRKWLLVCCSGQSASVSQHSAVAMWDDLNRIMELGR